MSRPLRASTAAAATVLLLLTAAGCSDTDEPRSTATPSPSTASTPSSAPSSSASPTPPPRPGSTPPAWLGTRELPTGPDGYAAAQTTPPELRRRAFNLPDPVRMLPGRGYASRVVAPAPARVLARSTWRPGCPVAREQLAWLRLTFRGFDGARHTGELLVQRQDADDLVQVFGDLWRADFPLERMVITTRADQDATPTGDGNDTSAFVCRPITGGYVVLRARVGARDRHQPVPEPLRARRPGAARAGHRLRPPDAGAPGDDHRRRPGRARPSPGSGGAGAAPGPH